MTRNTKWALRNLLHTIELSIPKTRTQINEWERDLILTACVAIWDENRGKIEKCLRRLLGSPERKDKYAQAYAMLNQA